MKKIATTLVLLTVLSITAFADGQYPIGGRGCPEKQVCSVNDGETTVSDKTDESIINLFIDYLKSILE